MAKMTRVQFSPSLGRLFLTSIGLVALAETLAVADPLGGAFFHIAGWAFALYSVAVLVVEPFVLNVFFKRGYLQCLTYSIAANVASAVLGYPFSVMILFTMMQPSAGRTIGYALLVVASFIVAIGVEWLVIWLILRRRMDARTIFRAVAWANVASYALTVPVVYLVAPG